MARPAIVTCTDKAARQVNGKLREAFASVLPEGLPFDDILSGKADLSTVMAPHRQDLEDWLAKPGSRETSP